MAMTLRLLIGVCIATSVAAQAPQPDAETTAMVRRLIETGRAAQAIEQLKALDRDDIGVRYLLGVAYYHADEHAKAIELLTPVVATLSAGSIERREAEQVLGLSLYAAGRFAEALPFLEATRTWARDNVELNYFIGLAYLQTGRIDPARSALAATFGIGAEEASASLVTAQTLIRLNLDQAAEGELKRALALEPRLPHANVLLGQLALFRGQIEESMRWTRRELAINAADATAWTQLGDAYVRQSKWREAIVMLQRSIWINPFYSAPYILLGRAYAKSGQPATAEGMLRRAIQYDPNNRTAHYQLAQLLLEAGRADEAKAELAIAEKLQGQPGR
jgi:tetratricopeptide (TPR) repeat protein